MSVETSSDLQLPTDEQIQDTAKTLSKLTPGYLPKPIFEQVARLWVTPIVELVPLRKRGEATEVLLLKRPDDDPNWPGMLHTPGTVLRSTDTEFGIDNALQRIFTDELGVTPASQPVFNNTVFHKVNRGSELASVYFVDMGSAPKSTGQWYNAESLPDNIVDTQIGFINDCIDSFLGGEKL